MRIFFFRMIYCKFINANIDVYIYIYIHTHTLRQNGNVNTGYKKSEMLGIIRCQR